MSAFPYLVSEIATGPRQPVGVDAQAIQKNALLNTAVQLENQQRLQQIKNEQAARDLFANSTQQVPQQATNPTTGQTINGPTKPQFVMPSEQEIYGAVGPDYGAKIMAAHKAYLTSAAQLQNEQGKHQAAALDYVGAAARGIQAANYDPESADLILSHMQAQPGFGEEIGQFRQVLSRNPQQFRQLVDNAVAMSAQQRTLSTKETGNAINYRKQGLDQSGQPLPYEQLSEKEQAVIELQNARALQAQATADLKKFQADPNSPQYRLAQQRIATAQQNANTAARKLGLEGMKFNADYLGIGPDGTALPGAQIDEQGDPIGPRVATSAKTQMQAVLKRYDTALDADQRLSRMEASYGKVLQGDQQAMLALTADHIGMTLGLQKGARITREVWNEAQESRPWLQGLASHFDSRGYLAGVTLSPQQAAQMLSLGYEARDRSWQGAFDESKLVGGFRPSGAMAVYNQRQPGAKPALRGGSAPTQSAPAAQPGKFDWSQMPVHP